MNMKKITIITLLTVLFSVTGCEKYLDVNKNTDSPDYVEGSLYLSGIQQAYEGVYWDIRALGPLTQMMGTSTTYFSPFAQNYYYAARDEGGEAWRMVYWMQGRNLENLINQSVEAKEWTLAGIGYAMKAFSWDLLTKLHGEVVLEDAFVDGLLTHDYDYQDVVYPKIREWAYKAIEYLKKEDNSIYSTRLTTHDHIYKGDKAKWIKFAYAVIVRNLASLSNKSDFLTKYYDELVTCAGKSFESTADDATVAIAAGSQSAPYSAYNNFWGTARNNLTNSYWQHDYAAQVMTGTVPEYDVNGNKTAVTSSSSSYVPHKLADPQIICDTSKVAGHFDPRVVAKLATLNDPTYLYIDNADSIKKFYTFRGSNFTSATSPIGVGATPSFWGRNAVGNYTIDGKGRWIYRDDAPYILMTCAEIKFCLAEAHFKKGEAGLAYTAFKEGVRADNAFTLKYLSPGAKGNALGGDKITTTVFNTLARQYEAGPYVDGLGAGNLTLSHIMMQKWVALYPWGAHEAWVDLRKYHYDIRYTGDYPSINNGWLQGSVDQKKDTDADKVYKGFYLAPAQVQHRKTAYNINNAGSPCFRLRPRYNSEYIWNIPSLEALKPVKGTAPNYHCSIPWFAYPGDYPTN